MKQNQAPNSRTLFGEALIADMNAKQVKLHSFTKIQDMPEVEPWLSIKVLYASSRFRDNAAACLINGAVSSGKRRFLLSCRVLQDYLREDVNLDRSWVKGPDFTRAMEFLLASINGVNILKCVSKGKKDGRGTGKNLAGTYEVVHPEVIPFIPEGEQYTATVHSESTPGMCLDGREPVYGVVSFRIGQTIVCIDDENAPRLTRGQAYQITGMSNQGNTIQVDGDTYSFAASRFEVING